jgi:hypothetical protein
MRGERARIIALVAAALFLVAWAGASQSSAQQAVEITPVTLSQARVGAAYSQTVVAGGPAPPYTVRVTQGALPAGLSLSPSGALAGTPTRAGSFAFTISAFTSDGTYVAFRDYVIRVSPAVRRSGKAYFADDFGRGLGKWNLWGGTKPFRLVRGRADLGVSITVGPSTTGPTSSTSEIAALWLDWPLAHADAGQETWYAAQVKFPKSYRPTTGQWNWFLAWHNDDATAAYPGAYSCALGIFTDYPVRSSPGRNPRIAFRLMGGSVTSPTQHVFALPRNSLKRGWWYDILVHFVWSADPSVGLAQLWIDGKRVDSTRFPTLYQHPNGDTSYNAFGLYNYRPKASWDASIYFDRVRIGPTRASVVGKAATKARASPR